MSALPHCDGAPSQWGRFTLTQPEATEFAESTMMGQRVALEPDPTQDRTDRYGRTLAYLVRADGWRSSRHHDRPELVHVLRDPSGAAVRSGWVEATTSLGRLIVLDQPGTGASDPIMSGALPTLEQWTDSITAVLDDLGSREAVLLAVDGAFATAALFAATHPSHTIALVVLE